MKSNMVVSAMIKAQQSISSVFSNDYKAYDMNNFGNEAKYGES